MDSLKKVFDQYGKVMDQEIVGVQLGCYSVALIGLTVAIRKVRPFSRFKKPQKIPQHFIDEKRELTGIVKRIEPNGGLLMVEHKPLVSLPIVPKGELPVKILGVKISGLGINWLQAIVVNSEIKFIPVIKETDYVQCNVLLPNIKPVVKEAPVKNKRSVVLKNLLAKKEEPFLNIGECLVKIGFAETTSIQQSILKENQYAQYYKSLHSAEISALKKKLGMRYYVKPSKTMLQDMLMKTIIYSRELVDRTILKVQGMPPKVIAG